MFIKHPVTLNTAVLIVSYLVSFAFLAFLTSSCIDEKSDKCTLDLTFRYLYNMQGTDGFGSQADIVDLYIFDSSNRFVGHHSEYVVEKENFTMHLPLPAPGKYTFVAWARGNDIDEHMSDFEIPELKNVVSPESLTARIRRTANVASNKQNPLLNGTLVAEVSGENRHLCIDMKKCTNDIRVILMPIRAGQNLISDNYVIRIEGKNGWLAYNAETFRPDPLTYAPHRQVRIVSQAPDTENPEIDNAIIADFSTSRIIAGSNPRLIVYNKRSNLELLDIDLAWFLSLQAIGEHKTEWSNQEYLDRQDKYALTFFVDDTTWLKSRIIVNDFVLSLEDIGLK